MRTSPKRFLHEKTQPELFKIPSVPENGQSTLVSRQNPLKKRSKAFSFVAWTYLYPVHVQSYPRHKPSLPVYHLLKPLLFALPPETAHKFSMRLLSPRLAGLWNRAINHDSRLQREVFGLNFPNPVGLAAGFDKEAAHLNTLAAMGFGFLEFGTVTPRPQAGNPRPRLFRLPKDKALINRMGFNNAGLEAFAKKLAARKTQNLNCIIGGNIGKNKTTPNEEALRDYALCFEKLFPHVDYFVVNVSSPNTPGLRALQQKKPLSKLLKGLQELNNAHTQPKPLLLKISPDLNRSQLDDVLQIAFDHQLSGLIATNTTISRENLGSTPQQKIKTIGAGGLSGSPLKQRSTEIIRHLHRESKGQLPIIGSGGILHPQDALEKLEAGASLIQIFTGLIYQGPALITQINKALLQSK